MIDNCFFLELASVHMHKAGKRREVGAMFGARVVIYKPSVKIYFPATSRTGIVSVSESCAPSGQGIISSPAAWSEYLGVFVPPLPRPGLNSSPAHVSFAGQYLLIKLDQLRVCVFTVFSTKNNSMTPLSIQTQSGVHCLEHQDVSLCILWICDSWFQIKSILTLYM